MPGKLLAREYERSRVPRACLFLDTQSGSDRRFEQIVSFAAANLLDLHRSGVAAALWAGTGDLVSASVPEALLAELAEVKRSEEACADLPAAVEEARGHGDLPVVIGDGTWRRNREAPWTEGVVVVDVSTADFRGRYQVRQGGA